VRNVEPSKRSLSPPENAKSVRQSGQREHGEVRRRTRGSASLPAPAVWFGPIISPVHTNDLALTRNEGLLLAVLFKTLLGQVCGLDAASTAPPKFLAERGFFRN
jgi:hypothetical protein